MKPLVVRVVFRGDERDVVVLDDTGGPAETRRIRWQFVELEDPPIQGHEILAMHRQLASKLRAHADADATLAPACSEGSALVSAPLHFALGKHNEVWVEVSPTDEDRLVRWVCECGVHGPDAPQERAYDELAAGERHAVMARKQGS